MTAMAVIFFFYVMTTQRKYVDQGSNKLTFEI